VDDLRKEMQEHRERIESFLSPKINGECTNSEREAYESERVQRSIRITEIEAELARLSAQEETKSKIVESAFSLRIGGQDITEGMAEEQREFITLLYDEISARVSEPLKAEIKEQEGIIRTLKSTIDEKNETIQATLDANKELSAQIDVYGEEKAKLRGDIEELKAVIEIKDTKINQLELDKSDAEQKRDNAVAQLEEARKEIERLNSHINDLQTAQAVGEVEAQKIIQIEATERTNRLQELAKKFMKGEQIGLYTEVIDQDGNKQVVSNRELERMEIVDSFPSDIPELESVPESIGSGTDADVENPAVVFDGGENTGAGDQTEEESEPDAETETAEAAPETADSEEVGKETEFVTRAEFEARVENVEKGMEQLMRKVFGEVAA
jgi:chromosome segregation ATPase